MAYDGASGRLYLTERESTSLIVLDTGLPSSPGVDLTYLYLGAPLAVLAIAVSAVLWRRRGRLSTGSSAAR